MNLWHRSDSQRLQHDIEFPSEHNAEFLRHLHSPWIVISQWLFNVAVVLILMVLFGVQHQFSDYLNERGQYRDRQTIEQQQYICTLIGALHDDTYNDLGKLATQLKCPTGPLPPRSTATPPH